MSTMKTENMFWKHADTGEPLPFLQLGDVFSKGINDPVYVVMSASCDLQFVPKEVSTSRIPDRRDTILLLPGSTCLPNECPKKSLSTGLIKINDAWRAVTWDRNKLTGVPHFLIRPLLQHNAGYNHSTRLRTPLALELQQQVFHQASKIGLEVQPPLADELDIRVFTKGAAGFVPTRAPIKRGTIRFHMPGKSVLVFKQSSLEMLVETLKEALAGNEDTTEGIKLAQLISKIFTNTSLLARTPLVEPELGAIKAFKAVDKFPRVALDGLALVVGQTDSTAMDGTKQISAIIRIGNSDE
jgi:hypothetical protein